MMSLTKSFSPSKHTPSYENEQNEREIMQWRLLLLGATIQANGGQIKSSFSGSEVKYLATVVYTR